MREAVATSLRGNWCDQLFGSQAQVSEHISGWRIIDITDAKGQPIINNREESDNRGTDNGFKNKS